MLLPLYDKNPSLRWPIVTALLIAANAVCFWLSVQNGGKAYSRTVYQHGFVPQRLSQIDDPQGLQVAVDLPEGGQEVYQLSTATLDVYPTLLTSMFLHGGLLHLIANLWMLWVFGDNVEDRLGRPLFLFFYVIGGVVAMLCQWASNPAGTTPVIGASGAIAAVLGAYAITFPAAKVKTFLFVGLPLLLDLPSALVLGAWLLFNLSGAMQAVGELAGGGPQIAYWTHIGGFVAGVILMPLLSVGAEPPDQDWRTESREMFEF